MGWQDDISWHSENEMTFTFDFSPTNSRSSKAHFTARINPIETCLTPPLLDYAKDHQALCLVNRLARILRLSDLQNTRYVNDEHWKHPTKTNRRKLNIIHIILFDNILKPQFLVFTRHVLLMWGYDIVSSWNIWNVPTPGQWYWFFQWIQIPRHLRFGVCLVCVFFFRSKHQTSGGGPGCWGNEIYFLGPCPKHCESG